MHQVMVKERLGKDLIYFLISDSGGKKLIARVWKCITKVIGSSGKSGVLLLYPSNLKLGPKSPLKRKTRKAFP
jgi:hypothetical protein